MTSRTPGLARRAVRVTTVLVIVQAVVLFLAAGSLAYWNAWLFVALQALSMGATNVYLYRHDPALLDRRLASEEAGERDPVQRRVLSFLRVASLVMLIAAGLEWRLGARAPLAMVIAGTALFVLGAGLIFRVFRESTYTSSVIEVVPGQHVVASGPYRWVRHPMYLGVLIMGLGIPLLLGSAWAALTIVPSFAALVVRITREERFLRAELAGYEAYASATRSRLVPGIW